MTFCSSREPSSLIRTSLFSYPVFFPPSVPDRLEDEEKKTQKGRLFLPIPLILPLPLPPLPFFPLPFLMVCPQQVLYSFRLSRIPFQEQFRFIASCIPLSWSQFWNPLGRVAVASLLAPRLLLFFDSVGPHFSASLCSALLFCP